MTNIAPVYLGQKPEGPLAVPPSEYIEWAGPPIIELTKEGHPTTHMRATWYILVELAASDNPLNVTQISTRTDLDRRSVRRYCQQLAKLGLLHLDHLQKTNYSIPLYSLTLHGKIEALAMDAILKGPPKIDRQALYKDVIEQLPNSDPLQRFGNKFLSICLKSGRTDILAKWFSLASLLLLNPRPQQILAKTWTAMVGLLNPEQTEKYLVAIDYLLQKADGDECFRVAILLARLESRNVQFFQMVVLNRDLKAIKHVLRMLRGYHEEETQFNGVAG